MQCAKIIYHLKLAYCIFIISFIQLIIGCAYAFTPNLINELQNPTSTIKLTTEEESWITSIPVLVCPMSLLVLGVLMDKIGRKNALLITYVPLLLSWIIVVYSNSIKALIISRIVLGLSYSSLTCEFVYIAEISPSNMRTVYCSCVPLSVSVGMLIESALSMYLDWPTVAIILCGMSAIGFVGMFAVPESPMWLRANGRTEEAQKVDRWFDPMRSTAASADDGGLSRPSDGHRPAADAPRYWSLFTDRTVWLPASILLTYFVCQQGSGVYLLMFYSTNMFRNSSISWDGVDFAAVGVYLGISRVVGGLCFMALHRVRRKTLSALSGVGMAASLFIIIAYGKTFADVQSPPLAFTPIVAIVLYMFFAMFGVVPLPWTLAGEVFPMPVRGLMNGLIQTFGYFLIFLTVKIYPSSVLYFGMENVWTIIAVMCILTVLFSIFIMPETKGKSIEEILSYFESHDKTIKKNTPI